MLFGHDVFGTKSTKQKLNTKSSTEAEVVGVIVIICPAVFEQNFVGHIRIMI